MIDMENKDKKVDALKNELAQKLLNEIIPECASIFHTKGFDAAIAYAVNKGINFAVSQIKKSM